MTASDDKTATIGADRFQIITVPWNGILVFNFTVPFTYKKLLVQGIVILPKF